MKETMEAHVCNCVNLRRAANRLTQYYDDILKPYGLSTNQFTLMASLSKNPNINTGELANKMSLDRTTVIRNLKPLIARNLIVKVTKGKINILSLSSAGIELLKPAYQAWKTAQKNYQQYLGEESLIALRELLVKTANI